MQSTSKVDAPAFTQEQLVAELERFLSTYGATEPPQLPDAAETDTQIKNLILTLAQAINASPKGTIVDIGAGKGVLLQRLSGLDAFVNSPNWVYAAAEFEEAANSILKLATDLRVHRRVEFLTLDELYSGWLPSVHCPPPYVVVIRNVFHELDIFQTSTLFKTLITRLQPTDTVIIQDLLVMHTAERGNACWTADAMSEVLQKLGFKSTFVVEPTSRGNRWLTFVCNVQSESCPVREDKVLDIIRNSRHTQLLLWKELGSLVKGDNRATQIALIDFDLQVAALQTQLFVAKTESVEPLTNTEQNDAAHDTFTKHLARFDVSAFVQTITPLDRPPNFRDRAHSQDALEGFLLDNSSLVLIVGGTLMGKTYLVQEVLARRAHDRQVISIDMQVTTSIWNMVEQYLTGLGCVVPTELLAGFEHLAFSALDEPFRNLVDRVSRNSIVCLDHFERLLDPNSKVTDIEIRDFLGILTTGRSAKVIITSRREPNLGFLPNTVRVNTQQPAIGRFPNGDHVENVLDDFVNRAALGISAYPDELLSAIDRLPYLAALAGRVIRAEGESAIQDPKFLLLVKKRLRDALMLRILTPEARPAVELLRILRVAIPRLMFEALAGASAVKAAEELGLIYALHDRMAGELLSGPDILRRDFERLEETDEAQLEDRNSKRKHLQIGHWYERLYRETQDPRWLRESYFHATVFGDSVRLERFGNMYRDEIFGAGESWFLRKDFKGALSAFESAFKLGLRTYHCRLRLASCLMRVNNRGAGEEQYRKLIEEYESTNGPKTSYIDSLLYCRDFAAALEALRRYRLTIEDDPWIAHEYGRAYLGLHQYADAVRAFGHQLSVDPSRVAYHMLARAYQRLGDRDEVARVLEEGLGAFWDDSNLKLDYAAHLIRSGEIELGGEAENLLLSLPMDGRVLQQLVKLLCSQGRADEAAELMKKRDWQVSPERYKKPIEVEIYIAKDQFKEALAALRNVPADDEHLTGMKIKTYLRWARREHRPDEQKRIALDGLSLPVDPLLRTNIPIMVTLTRLALIAEDSAQYDGLLAEISALNSNVAVLLHDEVEKEIAYWEEFTFDA